MSALNVRVDGDVAHIYTDGAIYGPDGRIVALVNKVVSLPHLGAAIATTGDARAGTMIMAMVAELGIDSFDNLHGRLAEILRAIVAHPVCAGMAGFQVVLAGWSELRGSTEAWFMQTFDQSGLDAFKLAGPIDDLSLPNAPGAAAERDPVAKMELQRLADERIDGHARAHTVGGFVQHTIVSREGIGMQIVKRWPDVVGERIDPISPGH